jgi:hypothetical protein
MPYKDPEKKKANDAAYNLANLERNRATGLQWRRQNRDILKAKNAARYAAKKQELKELHHKYYLRNLEKFRLKNKAYCKLNQQNIRDYKQAYNKSNRCKINASRLAARRANPEKAKMVNARQSNPDLPIELICLIALKNLIKEEIKNQNK